MISTGIRIEDLTLNITEEIQVRASLDATFAALLEQLGPQNEIPSGTPMPMKLEAWAGGKWYRDLGENNGHFWAVVQAIKRPTLLEFSGPLFLSAAVISNVQYRLSEAVGGTLIKFRHSALGMVPEEQRAGMTKGWAFIHDCVKKRAEKTRTH